MVLETWLLNSLLPESEFCAAAAAANSDCCCGPGMGGPATRAMFAEPSAAAWPRVLAVLARPWAGRKAPAGPSPAARTGSRRAYPGQAPIPARAHCQDQSQCQAGFHGLRVT